MAAVGIIGGLGVGATIHYYEKITAACKARGVVPDLVVTHADVDYGQGGSRGQARRTCCLSRGLHRAHGPRRCDGGGDPCGHATHLHQGADAPSRIPLINIVDVLATELRSRGTKRIALFGSVFTVQGSLWGQLGGVEIVKPQPGEIAFIGQAYQRILDGRSETTDADALRRIASDLRRRDGVETILLAGTDLAVMFDEQSAGFPCLDVARLHIDAIVERLTSSGRRRLNATSQSTARRRLHRANNCVGTPKLAQPRRGADRAYAPWHRGPTPLQDECVAGPEPERLLIDEFCSCPEMRSRHRQDGNTLRDQLVEHRKRGRALLQIDLSGPQLDGHATTAR